jgi:hypothetical protein
MNNAQEVPVSAHIFEGHLYIKDPTTNKWLWRLFRFDGTSLACLSSKKIKLPPHTLLESYTSTVDQRHLSFPTISTSHTSPLLATPKDKSARLINNSSCTIASYYQLPKWTIDIINISSISILKPNKAFKHPFSNSSSKCFCIRTFNGDCHVMKAHTQDDLERWIFVLSKIQVARDTPDVIKDNPAHNNCLSNEKVIWIEEWIKSLEELAEFDCMESKKNKPGLKRRRSIRRKPTEEDSINFFQDVHTIYTADDDEYSNKEYKHHSLTYHNLIREQRVRIVQNEPEQTTIKVAPPIPPIHNNIKDDYSPLENLKNKVNCVYDTHNLLLQQPFKVQNDENICLADVRKSLQNMTISNKKQSNCYSVRLNN